MTKDEMTKLAGMLDAFFTSAPANRRASANENIFLAYSLALEPYPYAKVREAVIEHSRKSRMYPDPAEIIACMPQDPNTTLWGAAKAKTSVAWMKPHLEVLAALEEERESVSRYAREHGMTWDEAAAEMAGGAT